MIYELVTCVDCMAEGEDLAVIKVSLQDILRDGIKAFQCEHGHRSLLVSSSQPYEDHVYFAASSLVNGNYRDAMTTMASAYDGFIEFSIRVMLAYSQVELNEIEVISRKMKLSERKIGGFNFLFLSIFKELPAAVSNSTASLRNNVIHNAYLPSEDEAKGYLLKLYENIYLNLKTIDAKLNIQSTLESQTHSGGNIGSFAERHVNVNVSAVELFKFVNLRSFEGDFDVTRFDVMLGSIRKLNDLKILKYLP